MLERNKDVVLMNEISKKIELRRVGRYHWANFKRSFKIAFRDDPELRNASRIERFFLFRMIRKNAENYLCYLEGKKAGVLSIRTNRASEVFIYAIAVEPKFRKRGLGKYMMNFTEERAKKLKKKFIALAVLWNNDPAIELYKKYNYQALGEGHTFIRIAVDDIKPKQSYDLTFERITVYNKSIRKSFESILLQGITEISGSLGVEYMKRNRTIGYHPQIKKNLDKGANRLFQIIQNGSVLGYLFERDNNKVKRVSVFSKLETWNLDFIQDLGFSIKRYLIKSSEIIELNMRLPLHEANKLENLEALNFTRDRSSEKLILFKKI
ncbi:MAG: GNAT family N-acetyltransferase [Candidatus Heimdallarchaeota archaeon]|nr:GNAT family N-acetyltransferase [Candidatus Heimdallarchaeota archaeon]MCK4770192.1 GNAT family N-acetyltransferase [Candidatus Heimdallarchaeota archaeon]